VHKKGVCVSPKCFIKKLLQTIRSVYLTEDIMKKPLSLCEILLERNLLERPTANAKNFISSL